MPLQVFEDTPSVEQLRAILIPESHGGMTRRIEMPRPADAPRPVQPAAATGTSSPPQLDTTPGTAAPAAMPAAAPAPQQVAPPPPAKPIKAKAAPAARQTLTNRTNRFSRVFRFTLVLLSFGGACSAGDYS